MQTIRSFRAPLAVSAVLALLLVVPAAATASGALPGRMGAALADPSRKEPYLIYPGIPGQMEVLWQLDQTATSTLEWGTDDSYALGSVSSPEYGSDHQHAFTITGLAPGARYLYRVTSLGYAHTGSFVATPLPGTRRFKFLAYGDTRTNPATHDLVAGSMLSAIAADPEYQSLALMVGDFVYYGNNETYWTSEFFSPAYRNIRTLLSSVGYQACMGNHENSSPVLFVKYFPYPFVAGRYWSFDAGPAHVTVIDQYTAYTPGSAELQWVANDLAATNRTWKIVLFHEPGWGAGPSHGNNASVQSYLEPLFEQYGVALAFCGHNHNYARALVNGIHHVTTGGGGAPIETPSPFYPNIVTCTGANHFCRVAIDGPRLTVVAVTPAGAVLDSFTLDKSAAEAVPPSAQVLSPAGGEVWDAATVHSILWSARDNVGVDSVNVDLSIHGAEGPWTALAHGVPNSGQLDWTVPALNSDSAVVRVTAFDFSGNSTSAINDALFQIANPVQAVDVPAPGAALERPAPNPGRGRVLLSYALPAPGRARLEIVDLGGRRVWANEATVGAGRHTMVWTGRGPEGREVRPGIYFVRLTASGATRIQRLVWLR